MVLKVFSADSIGAGVRAEMSYGDMLFVGEDATVARTDAISSGDAAVRALAGNNTLDIRGTVLGGKTTILLGDNASADNSYKVMLSSTALVKSFDGAAIELKGTFSDITNDGQIDGRIGISFNGASTATGSLITNNGGIDASNYGFVRGSAATESMWFANNGTVSGKLGAYYSPDSISAMDTVVNSGVMTGNIELGGGSDVYDGKLGTVSAGNVYGGSGGDTLVGGAGADSLYGDNDADYLDGGAGDDALNGGNGDDVLFGGIGNDTLDGGDDVDMLRGGAGDDTYVADNVGDSITEIAGEGIDTVKAAIDYTLTANVENLTLTSADDISGTGNALANIITGDDGHNTLKGMAGNDMLDGGLNSDLLEGGIGNDTYVVDNADDTIVELKDQGTDTVKALVSYTLSDNVEKLILTGPSDSDGTGNAGANTLTGNDGKNTLKGMDGNDTLDGKGGLDTLVGGKGNDTYIVGDSGDIITEVAGEGTDTVKASKSYTLSANVEKLILTGTANLNGTGSVDANTLTGNTGANTLKGMDGNDVLDGGAGADRMEGGLGNDTFVVDNAGDKIVELSGEGTDTVRASVSHTLAANVEKLVLTGTGNLNGTGNELANTLTGNAGKNILKGMAGNDLLDGGAGADRLEGGLGKDTYVVDNAGDKVVELSGEGTDTVKASVSHTLAANVEKLVLTGTGNLNGTGNELANTLTGNAGVNILKGMAGNDTLVGGAGADQLYGGAGKDMFVFNSASDSKTTAMDKIFDFSHAEGDRIDLHAIDANGVLAGDQAFSFIGTSAFHNKVGELRFEQKSGDTLIHGDINGDGKADFTIAVDPLVTFTASDFLL
ncbi:calcium-binding protein [Shinella sp. WSJ-2]|uniref:calcium-binding protein n=1 Tax=Shinella sp. WSJ-2 TaxID=2303749 RepID=UPI0013141E4B|nr:calcium-binding protein [Shinella sp. WSJ-2]